MPHITISDTMPTADRALCRDANASGGLPQSMLDLLAPESIADVTRTHIEGGKPTIYSGWDIEQWDVARHDGSRATLYIAGEGNADGTAISVCTTVEDARRALGR